MSEGSQSGLNPVTEDTGYSGGEVWDRPKPETRVDIDLEVIDCDAHIVETTPESDNRLGIHPLREFGQVTSIHPSSCASRSSAF